MTVRSPLMSSMLPCPCLFALISQLLIARPSFFAIVFALVQNDTIPKVRKQDFLYRGRTEFLMMSFG